MKTLLKRTEKNMAASVYTGGVLRKDKTQQKVHKSKNSTTKEKEEPPIIAIQSYKGHKKKKHITGTVIENKGNNNDRSTMKP